ncbi:MAG: SPOR domain-containing protein [Rhodobacterales bacterium]|nr:SPOR domain-containing protein [Rhodobacterales bacterium]
MGTYGEPANAAGVQGRLRGLGLPVAQSRITRNGRAMQIVLAGPFADPAQAASALASLRGAGFTDAFIRQ